MAKSAKPASKHELVLLEPYKQKPHPTGCGFFAVHRHLPGRVDLRVDHGRFGTHMNIQESPRADNPVRLSSEKGYDKAVAQTQAQLLREVQKILKQSLYQLTR